MSNASVDDAVATVLQALGRGTRF